MTQPFFVKFMKIWKTFLLLASKANYKVMVKSKIFLVIMSSLSFKMVYYIMMFFCMFLMALHDFKIFRLGTIFWMQAILDSVRPWS
jgi:hypothetical protein